MLKTLQDIYNFDKQLFIIYVLYIMFYEADDTVTKIGTVRRVGRDEFSKITYRSSNQSIRRVEHSIHV